MALHTDVPDAVHAHPVTGRIEYFGSIRRFTEDLTEYAHGGQVVMSSAVFGRLQVQNGLCRAISAYEIACSQRKRKKVEQKRFDKCDSRA